MPGTHTQLLIHVVFATKHREPWLRGEIGLRMHAYLGGILRGENAVPIAIGGIEDHVHLYIRLRADAALSDLMRIVKGRTSRWAHASVEGLERFEWQEGYSAFSVSRSQDQTLRNYVANQVEHHRTRDFREELLQLLTAHGIDFQEKYVFD